MDTLQATYKDEEDEDEDLPLAATTATTADQPAASVATDMESTYAPLVTATASTPSDTLTEPQNDGKSELDPSDDPSSDEAASNGLNSPKQSRGDADEDEEEPPPKKQKQLSSLVKGEESVSLPEENNGTGNAAASTATTSTPANGTVKKSKKKNNNVWATKSTRKGKKKSKNNNNNNNTNNQTNGGEDSVLVTPVPRFPDKTDDTPDMKICLSKIYKAEKVELSEDRLSAGSTKGYRMVRATRGVIEGAWYFEIKVVRLGGTGHTRLGWAMEKGDLQAPVGYDGNSFGYRDIDGSKIHKALREKYGDEGYGEGDVIGFYINLPDGDKYAPKNKQLVWYKGQRYAFAQDAKEDPPKVVPVRIPLQIWVNQKSNGFPKDDDIVPLTTVQLDIFWKEMDGDADWVRANDIDDGVDEDYDSSRDDISSVSSYNPTKENMYRGYGSSLSLRSISAKSLNRDALEGHRTSLSSNIALPRLSVAEVLSDSGADALSTQKSFAMEQQKFGKQFSAEDDAGVSSSPESGAVESLSSEGFIRGRSYNIRLDDQILLKFSPKNSDSTYYFSDMIGGTLTFFHEEGARRCLEISVTLETSETINRRFVHPSRRNSPTITKVQSDHHEVVADLLQTSFLFSVPMDGPMTFSTPHVSVQWVLRFEFYTTPKFVDWTKYEHPLLIERREKTEWILPITVHAPPPRTPTSGSRSERLFSLDPMWVHT